MIRSLLVLLALAAPAHAADRWRVTATDDGAFFQATASPDPDRLSLHCGGRSPAGNPAGARPEPLTSPRGQAVLLLGADVLGGPTDASRTVTFDIDGARYPLPDVAFDYFEGSYGTTLPLDAPMLGAMALGDRVTVVYNGRAIAELGLVGAARSIRRMALYCIGKWAEAPAAPPPEPTAAAPSALQRRWTLTSAEEIARAACNGPADIDPRAVLFGRLDGDAVADMVLDWGGVTCTAETFPLSMGAGQCGASQCAIDVYLSETFDAAGAPETILAVGARLNPRADGRDEVVMGARLAICDAQGLSSCETVFRVENGKLVFDRTVETSQ